MFAKASDWRRSRAPAALLLLSSLACDSTGLQGTYGELEVAGVRPAFGKEATVSVGEALTGEVATGSLWLRNAGVASLTLSGLVAESGARAVLGEVPDPEHPFSVDLPVGQTLQPGAEMEVAVAFLAEAATAPREIAGVLRLTATGTSPGGAAVTARLSATALPSPCAVPVAIDFGVVLAGQRADRSLMLANPLSRSSEAHLGAPAADVPNTASNFFYANGGPGTVSLPAAGEREVVLSFQPSEAREYQASVEVQAAPTCPAASVRLAGQGRARFLEWEPAQLDCGMVLPGESATRTLRFINRGPAVIVVTNARIELGDQAVAGDFGLPEASWGRDGALRLGAGESVERAVECAPATLGRRTGTLVLATEVAGQETARIDLEATGGGPRIAVAPPFVDLGEVYAYELGVPVAEKGMIAVSNAGGALFEDRQKAALRLGTRLAGGSYGPPFVRVEPLNEQTSADEVFVELTYSPELLPQPWGGEVSVAVRLAPRSAGSKRARVWVLSSDAERIEGSFEVTAEVRYVAPCQYRLTPNPLDFGVVHFSAPKTLGFTFENSGNAPCIVTVKGIVEGAEEYALEKELRDVEVAPGMALPVRVTLAPRTKGGQEYTSIPGRIALRVSSPSRPEPEVALEGGTGLACFAFLPTELDFGALEPGDRSEERQARVLHACAGLPDTERGWGIRIRKIALAGGSPDFELRIQETIPEEGYEIYRDLLYYEHEQRPNPSPAALRYSPRSGGEHEGMVVFEVEHPEGVMRHALPLRGRANVGRWAEVSFEQGGGDPVDILLFLPTEMQLDWPRKNMSARMPQFLTHLAASGNDFQLGMHWIFSGANWDDIGDMQAGPEHPDRILRANTPNLLRQIQAKFDISPTSYGGNCTYGLWRAIVPPSSAGANAGFLRPGARFALIYMATWNETMQDIPIDEEYAAQVVPFPVKDLGDFAKTLASFKGVDRTKFSFASLVFMRPHYRYEPGNPTPIVDTHCYFGTTIDQRLLPFSQMPRHVMAAATRGEVGELCPASEADWPPIVEMLAETASGLRTHFRLPAAAEVDPSPGSLEVFVDGTPVAPTNAQGQTVWEYDPGTKSVHFPVERTARPGQKVRVRYRSPAPPGE